MPDRDEIDQLLDAAIASYAEPRFGLEQRMLARIAEEREAGKTALGRSWLPWASAVPVAATLLFLFLAGPKMMHRSQPQPMASRNSTWLQPRPHLEAVPEGRPAAPRARLRMTKAMTHSPELPKLDVFPTPVPLTADERSLVTAILPTSATEWKSPVVAEEKPILPLSIAAIEIPLIAPSDQDGN